MAVRAGTHGHLEITDSLSGLCEGCRGRGGHVVSQYDVGTTYLRTVQHIGSHIGNLVGDIDKLQINSHKRSSLQPPLAYYSMQSATRRYAYSTAVHQVRRAATYLHFVRSHLISSLHRGGPVRPARRAVAGQRSCSRSHDVRAC